MLLCREEQILRPEGSAVEEAIVLMREVVDSAADVVDATTLDPVDEVI
jgi:hypothetical protein